MVRCTSVIIVVLALACTAISGYLVTQEDADSRKNQYKSSTESRPAGRQWITQLLSEAEKRFEMNGNENTRCRRDFERYKMHLQNQTVWAVRSKKKYSDLAKLNDYCWTLEYEFLFDIFSARIVRMAVGGTVCWHGGAFG